MLCYATTGVRPSPEAIKQQLQAQVAGLLQALAAPPAPAAGEAADGVAAPAAGAGVDPVRRLRELRRSLDPAGEVLTPGDAAAAVLGAVLCSAVPAPALAAGAAAPAPPSAVQLYRDCVSRLTKWGTLKPLSLMTVKAPKDQACLLDALQRVCYPPADGAAIGAGLAVGGGAFPAIGPKLLQWLYEADALTEEGMQEWVKAQGAAAAATPFMEKVVKPFLTWLQEAEEEDEDDEDEDEDEE